MPTTLFACIILTLFGDIAPTGPTLETVEVSAKGSIRGAVTDPAGAFIPGARITATDEATGGTFQTTADANGRYQLLQLPAGSYLLESNAEATPRSPVERADKREVTVVYTAVEVGSGHMTNVDISFHSPEEALVMCGCSMDDDSLEKSLRATSPRDPEAALHIFVSSRAVPAGSEVWLTVVLTNIAGHSISIPVDKDSGHAFAYSIGLSDPCNCPIGGARIGENKNADEDSKNADTAEERNTSVPVLLLAPGASLTDRVELGKLLNLAESRTYVIRVARFYNSAGKAVTPSRNPGQTQLSITSNRISVTVMPPERK